MYKLTKQYIDCQNNVPCYLIAYPIAITLPFQNSQFLLRSKLMLRSFSHEVTFAFSSKSISFFSIFLLKDYLCFQKCQFKLSRIAVKIYHLTGNCVSYQERRAFETTWAANDEQTILSYINLLWNSAVCICLYIFCDLESCYSGRIQVYCN